jgi:hypothetical protein
MLFDPGQVINPVNSAVVTDWHALITKLPEIILIPLAGLMAVTFLRGATGSTQFGYEEMVDIGMDLSILSMGTSPSIFANDTLIEK